MTYPSTLAVASIIQRHEALQLEVLSCCHEVLWPDGSSIQLHAAKRAGLVDKYLRALHHGGQWHVVDLRRIVPGLSAELAAAPTRDEPGLVLYGLRGALHHARAFLALLPKASLASWPGSPRAAVPRPSRRGDQPLTAGAAA